MEEKYILTTKTHEDWRNYLIVNSFFFDVLLKKLRSDLGLPEEGLENDQQIAKWDGRKMMAKRKQLTPKSKLKRTGVKIVKDTLATEDDVRRSVYKPIWDVIEKFSDYNLNFSLIRVYVLGDRNISFRGSSRVLMVSSPSDPIKQTGVYIKYSPELSEKEMASLMKQANEAFKTLFSITHKSTFTKNKSGKLYVKRPKLKVRLRRKSTPRKNQLKIYIEVQDYLRKNYTDNPDSIVMNNVFKDVASKMEANEGSIKRSYHALMNNFQLPTGIDTRKISN